MNQELFDFRTESGTYSSVNDGWIFWEHRKRIDEDAMGFLIIKPMFMDIIRL